MKTLLFLLLLSFLPRVQADQVEKMSDLVLLPAYCRGTQLIRVVSQDRKSMEEYVAIYGKSFYHLHHYCWALHTENKYTYSQDKFLKSSKLVSALGDIQYTLDRAEPGFVLLPEIYTGQARLLFTLRRNPEAVLALQKAIDAKPDYVPAIARLSDYYLDQGNKAQAIKTLEQGIDQTEAAATLIKRLEKLGKTYVGVPGHAQKKDVPKEDASPASKADERAPDAPALIEPAAVSAPTPPLDSRTDEQKKANPYCRFCP